MIESNKSQLHYYILYCIVFYVRYIYIFFECNVFSKKILKKICLKVRNIICLKKILNIYINIEQENQRINKRNNNNKQGKSKINKKNYTRKKVCVSSKKKAIKTLRTTTTTLSKLLSEILIIYTLDKAYNYQRSLF